MKLNVRAREKNYLEVEIEGEDQSFPNALREILIEDEDVEFASYVMEHPEVSHPRLILRTSKKDPLTLLKKAVRTLKKQVESLKSSFEKKR